MCWSPKTSEFIRDLALFCTNFEIMVIGSDDSQKSTRPESIKSKFDLTREVQTRKKAAREATTNYGWLDDKIDK